ncbi:hypothetical protein KFL_000490200 [Klebsormidium nitens]|uniref:SURP motif domain-containing protein n=1 Tax=Klebsormidium nitens TaxID=105231 RepID=A0A0U9HIB0_KLENI|nr:hypothetical protein KFL_000490200 [Klebsormidium nitens]|eukprot:GAQ80230.1 hypothetical protein KFL_000490200 [Klebsormidium nitens]
MAGHVDLFVDERRKRRRQKGQKGRSSNQLNQESNLLEAIGYSCTLFSDEVLAAYLDSEESLLPWIGDPELRIDRYDARHLLTDVSSLRKGQAEVRHFGKEDEDEEALDRERYFDLENAPGTAEYLEELEEEDRKRQKVDGAAYKSVGFSYGETPEPARDEAASAAAPEPLSTEADATESFQPSYPVPTELLERMPASQKHHQVMLHTAKFVRTHGGQTEIILRVKQGSNPTFSFLMPEDPLHPFFHFMVENYERLAQAMQSKPQGETSETKERDAVSLVAAAYGEDDKDESEGEEGAQPSEEGEGGPKPSEEVEEAVQTSGEGWGAIQPSGEGREHEREDGNGTEGGDEATKGQGLFEDGQERGSLEERSVRTQDCDASAGDGLKEGPSEGGTPVQSSCGARETTSHSSEALENTDVQVETPDRPAEQVLSEAGEKGKAAAGPSAPAVRFAIAKNPPLAAVRKIKSEAPVSGVEKGSEASSGAGRKGSELLDDSVVDQPSKEEGKPSLASGVKEPQAAGVNEPLAAGVNGLPPSGVTEPLPAAVNEPLAVGVNEPPLQTKRVIEKMVEFIARNGRQFEEVVRKKDEGEGRFPFLAPGDSYHGYYASLLDEVLRKKGLETVEPTVEQQPGAGASLPDSAAETLPPLATAEPPNHNRGASSKSEIDPSESTQGGSGEHKQTELLFFGETKEEDVYAQSGRPAGLGADAVRAAVLAATRTASFGSHTELKGLENRVRKRGASPIASDGQETKGAKRSKPAGLGIDAVRAAVLQATRTPSPSVSANRVANGPPEVKPSGLGIDAVRAAVMKATWGKAFEDQDGLQERAETAVGAEVSPMPPLGAKEGGLSPGRLDASTSGGLALVGQRRASLTGSLNHETLSEKAAVEAARTAAAAAAGEADSSDARLTAAEKKRAERLKRAKMFAAMLGGRVGAESSSLGGSGAGERLGLSGSGVIGAIARDGSADVSRDVGPGGAAEEAAEAEAAGETGEAAKQKEVGLRGSEKGSLESPREEGEVVGEGELRKRVAGEDRGEGEQTERRQKRDCRHRGDDYTGSWKEEDGEERRRRRKERRERKARGEAGRNGSVGGEELEVGGSGKDVEGEERRRRKRHRDREGRREREETPEEGEIRGEEPRDGGTDRYRSRRGEEERGGLSRERIDEQDRALSGSERPREAGKAGRDAGERRGEKERDTWGTGTGSAEVSQADVVAGKRAPGNRPDKLGLRGRGEEAATGLIVNREVEGRLDETESVLQREAKSGADSHIDVPESVRAKVRAMLGLS